MPRIAVIGGGYTGTAFAVHLSRLSPVPLDIAVVEPRRQVGGGLAYSTDNPDHRLNAPDVIHPLYPEDELHFRGWLEHTGRLAADPTAWYEDQRLYPRRGDFGAYLTAQFADHAASNSSGSKLTHLRARAKSIERRHDLLLIELTSGECIEADRCVIAIGRTPAPFALPGSSLPGASEWLIGDPFAPGALAPIARDAEVLLLGTGLTSADTVATLLGQSHLGTITCLSRHGLRPKDQNPEAAKGPLWAQLAVQPPAFVERHGLPETMSSLLEIVRHNARDRLARGQPWHGAIDEVRDAAGEIWRALPPAEKSKFLRHVRPYYDVHRFRIPPQTRDILRAAENRGQLRFQAGRLVGVEPLDHGVHVSIRERGATSPTARAFGAVVSCVGLTSRIEQSGNPFVESCLRHGLARPSDMGRGLDSDGDCRVIAATGRPDPTLYVLGALTLDRCGETPAAIFLLRQILRMLPGFVRSLSATASNQAAAPV